jgi:subtilisin family serine protease
MHLHTLVPALLLFAMNSAPALALGAVDSTAAPPTATHAARAGARQLTILQPGQGLRQAYADGRVLRSQVVDASEPLRVIVALDAEPVSSARLRALDTALPRRRLDQLRADLAGLARMAPAGPSGAAGRAEITREYTEVFSGAAVTIDPALLSGLRALPHVREVFPDDSVHVTDDTSNHLINADRVRSELGGTGQGVRVGIIDTGIDYDHLAFGAGFGPGHRVAGGWDFVNDDADPRDDHGHGTHVAGIVAGNGGGVTGVAPQATLYAFKVLDAGGSGLSSVILTALERVLDPDADPGTDDALHAINLSLGASMGTSDDPMAMALDRLTEAGVVCVAAAGNDYSHFRIASPGTSRRAVTVGASARLDSVAIFSSRGPVVGSLDLKPDLVAPGVSIASAAMGGGTVAWSGTSMATPQVTGVAAQLLQLNPTWRPDDVKAALVGTARDLDASAFLQGAGAVDAWAAAHATFTITPTHLAFGRANDSVDVWTRRDTLRVRNLADETRTVVFDRETRFAGGATLVVPFDSIVVDPGQVVAVPVELTVDHSLTVFPRTEPFAYDAVLQVRSGSEAHRVPVSFHKAALVRARDVNAGGTNRWSLTNVVLFEPQLEGTSVYLPQGSELIWEWLVPPGDYDALATFWDRGVGPGPLIVREHVTVSGVVDLAFGQAEASRTFTFANVDQNGAPLECNRGSLALENRDRGIGMRFTGWPHDVIRVSPFSDAYSMEWTRTATDDRTTRRTCAGEIDGTAPSQVIRNLPSDLHRVALEFAALPADSLLPLVWEFTWYGVDGSYFGIGWANTRIPPVSEPFTFDQWLTPRPGSRLQLGTSLELLAWDDGDSPSPDRTLVIAPLLRLDHGWPIETYSGSFRGALHSRFGGQRMRVASGLPVWRGQFANSPGLLALHGGADPWAGRPSKRLLWDMYGGLAEEPDALYTLSRDGVVIASDTLQGSGSLSSYGSHQIPTTLATCTLTTARAWSLGGQPASLEVAATMNTLALDRDPPSLRSLQVFADGGGADSIAFATVADAGVRFLITDEDALVATGVSIRAAGDTGWTALTTLPEGEERIARLPPTLSGPIDLRLESTDATGNQLTLVWAPAFVAQPTVSVRFMASSGTPMDDGVHLRWVVEGGAGLRFVIVRSGPDTDWESIGLATGAADGSVEFLDSGAPPAGTYGYRVGLANGGGGTSTYSVPLWVSTSARPRLAITSVGPNPTTGPSLTIGFTIPTRGPTRLGVFDIAGRCVLRQALGTLDPGSHTVGLTTAGVLRPGIWFVQVEHGGGRATGRLCVVR